MTVNSDFEVYVRRRARIVHIKYVNVYENAYLHTSIYLKVLYLH